MKTVDEILGAARRLTASQFLQLRTKLDRIEESVWEAELQRTTAELKKAKITDRDVDRFVLRRRRESRS